MESVVKIYFWFSSLSNNIKNFWLRLAIIDLPSDTLKFLKDIHLINFEGTSILNTAPFICTREEREKCKQCKTKYKSSFPTMLVLGKMKLDQLL